EDEREEQDTPIAHAVILVGGQRSIKCRRSSSKEAPNGRRAVAARAGVELAPPLRLPLPGAGPAHSPAADLRPLEGRATVVLAAGQPRSRHPAPMRWLSLACEVGLASEFVDGGSDGAHELVDLVLGDDQGWREGDDVAHDARDDAALAQL